MTGNGLGRVGFLAFAVLGFWWLEGVRDDEAISPLAGDLVNYYLPVYDVAFERISRGVPLWNPWNLAGLPWLATLQTGLLYPPHALYVLLPVHVGLAASHVVHLLLIAISTAALARRWGLSPAAAALAALLFTLIGPNWYWLIYPPMLEAGAWIALGCLAVQDLVDGRRRRGVALLALAHGMAQLAGYPQVTVYLAYVWASLFLALSVGTGVPLRPWIGRAALFTLGFSLGAALGAVQLLPSLAHSLEGTRALAPLPIGRISYLPEAGHWFSERLVFGSRFAFGPIGLALLPAALATRRHRRIVFWALALGGVTCLLALFGESWAHPFYGIAPGISIFRDPLKLMLVPHFCVALLAGFGLDAVVATEPRRARLAVVAGCTAVAVSLAVPMSQVPLGLALALGAAVLALPRLAPGPAGSRGFQLFAIALALVAAATAESRRGGVPYSGEFAARYRVEDPLLADLAERTGEDRFAWLPPRVFYAVKFQARNHVRGLDDYEPMNLRRQGEYFDYFLYGSDEPADPANPLDHGVFFGAILRSFDLPFERGRQVMVEVARRQRMLDLLATRWFVALRRPEGHEIATAYAEAAGLVEVPAPFPRYRLFENPRALPRAFVTYRTRAAPERRKLLRRLSQPRFDPLESSFVEAAEGFAQLRGHRVGHPAEIVRDGETVVEIEADLAAPGLLVLADSVASGWRATVDGEPAPILATNHLARGVPVSPGRHRIRFEYDAPGFRAGLALSGTALVVVAALLSSLGRRTDGRP